MIDEKGEMSIISFSLFLFIFYFLPLFIFFFSLYSPYPLSHPAAYFVPTRPVAPAGCFQARPATLLRPSLGPPSPAALLLLCHPSVSSPTLAASLHPGIQPQVPLCPGAQPTSAPCPGISLHIDRGQFFPGPVDPRMERGKPLFSTLPFSLESTQRVF